MTTPTDPGGDGDTGGAEDGVPDASVPYLPASQPTATGIPTPVVVPPAPGAPPMPAADPVVPPPVPPAAAPTTEPGFDARAMVEAQRRVNANPAYGALPTASDESRTASRQLRAKAARKRRRNRTVGWVVALLMLGGIGAAAWFGYEAYQDDQDDEAVTPVDDRSAAEILEDLGSQGEMINAQDALNDALVPRAGGLGSAIGDARDVVGDLDNRGGDDGGDADGGGASAATPFSYDVVVPQVVRDVGGRLPDASGRETYVIGQAEFATGDPEAFGLFVRLMSVQPQLVPSAPAFDGLPRIAPDEILISVQRSGDQVVRAIVVGESVDLRVDVTP